MPLQNRSTHSAAHERVASRTVSRARSSQAPRAGLRDAPRSDQPTGVFAVVEISVLVFVAALAMTSIIVSIDEADAGHRARPSAEARVQTSSAPHVDGATLPTRTEVARR